MNFMTAMKQTMDDGRDNISVTENGALGYKTTGKALLDMNFAVSSLRHRSQQEIEAMFASVCAENIDIAIVWLFFCRDVRGGLGERRLFRICFNYLAREFPEKALRVLGAIPEFGRWDDLLEVFDAAASKEISQAALKIIADQLTADMLCLRDDQPVSLLGKWLPSENTSSNDTQRRAKKLIVSLGMSPRKYRQMLSALRRRIDVVERKMSAKQWGEINYNGVPSRANLLYQDAFMTHDTERRQAYLDSLKKGEAKINASTLYPHEIVAKYAFNCKINETLEALWKNLPNTVPLNAQMMVVADGSGSMMWSSTQSNLVPLDVANALAIYFSEKLTGPYKDKYITFSSHPQYVDLSGATTLMGKLAIAKEHDECSNTNIEKVFDLILETAIDNHLRQDELPPTVLIISDMEFDNATYYHVGQPLFDIIAARYHTAGYEMPRLVFWNVNSRTNTIPVRTNPLGVALVSGFSPTVAKMIFSGKLDPYECLLDMLSVPRYDVIREALKGA